MALALAVLTILISTSYGYGATAHPTVEEHQLQAPPSRHLPLASQQDEDDFETCREHTPIADHFKAAEVKLKQLLKETADEPAATTEKPKRKPKTKKTPAPKVIDFSRLDVRVGKIISIQEIVTADNLYVEEIDVGEDITRTVVSALVDKIPLEELENKRVLVLCNVKPRSMKTYVSEGMLLCAGNETKIEVLEPPFGTMPGEKVTVEGYNGTPDEVLNPKHKIFETVAQDLKINEEKVATYKGVPLKVGDKGLIKTETLANVPIL